MREQHYGLTGAPHVVEFDHSLWVVTCVFNPGRYKTRIHLYREFEKYAADSGAKLLTVEVAHGARPFVVTQPDNPHHVQLRTNAELWHKERAINIGISRLPTNWQYVAWVDADVVFARPEWCEETVQMLQHYPILHMFSEAIDLGPECQPLQKHQSVIWAYQHGHITHATRHGPYHGDKRPHKVFHPGYAWAARRDAIDNLGGLFDVSILGSGDWQMAMALMGSIEQDHPKSVTSDYHAAIHRWEERAKKHIRGNVGYMPGLLLHYWHGRKRDRRYQDRWHLLSQHKYSPTEDLKMDSQGLYCFTGRNPRLEYAVRDYFQVRNEDSIDVD